MSPIFQRLTTLVVVLALAAPLSAFEESRSRYRTGAQAIVEAMNRERAAHGLRPLRLDSRLTLAAEDRANDMFDKRYFAHVSPDGINPFTWVRLRGYRYTVIGENLALGYRTNTAIVDGWMRSRGHRENILQRDFDEVGIAISNGSPKAGYRGPLVVALYGSR